MNLGDTKVAYFIVNHGLPALLDVSLRSSAPRKAMLQNMLEELVQPSCRLSAGRCCEFACHNIAGRQCDRTWCLSLERRDLGSPSILSATAADHGSRLCSAVSFECERFMVQGCWFLVNCQWSTIDDEWSTVTA